MCEIPLWPIAETDSLVRMILKRAMGPNVSNFKWIGQQDLPDLAKALKLDPQPAQHGVAIKIRYDREWPTRREAFFRL